MKEIKMKVSKRKIRCRLKDIRFTKEEIKTMDRLFDIAETDCGDSNLIDPEILNSEYWRKRLLILLNYIPAGKLYLNLMNIAHERKNELEKNK